MLLSKSDCKVTSPISIIDNYSFFPALLNIHIHVEDGQLDVLFSFCLPLVVARQLDILFSFCLTGQLEH